MTQVQYIVKDLKDTEKVAQFLARRVDLPAVLALTGDLGSGKTTFVQYLAQSFGIHDHIPSPTFTLIHEFPMPNNGLFVHADLYRLSGEEEIRQLGLSDYFAQPNVITVIEWADRFPAYIPENALWLNFTLTQTHRVITLRTKNSQFWQKIKVGSLS